MIKTWETVTIERCTWGDQIDEAIQQAADILVKRLDLEDSCPFDVVVTSWDERFFVTVTIKNLWITG